MIGQQIRKYREALGWSQPKLAKICQWEGYSRISNYEQGIREPKQSDIEIIANALGIHPGVLVYGDSFSPSESVKLNATSKIPAKKTSVIKVPVIDWTLALQGKNVFNILKKEAAKVEPIYFPAKPGIGKNLLALQIKGKELDAMISPSSIEKSFRPGEKIIYDVDAKVSPNKFVIASVPGEQSAIFRQYIVQDGIAFLKPLNPSYKMIEMTPSIKILGVVIGYAGEID